MPDERVDKGALHENFLLTEMMKAGISPNFWRTKSDAEVDFVYKAGADLVAVEAKSKLKSPTIPRSLKSFKDKYNPAHSFIMNQDLIHQSQSTYHLPYYLASLLPS